MTMPVSRRMDFSEIPVIDLSRMISGETDLACIESLERACREVGFFYVSHHGIDPVLIENLREQSARFFSLPMEKKLLVKLDQRMRGYLPLAYRSFEGEKNAATNHQEGFWIGHDLPISESDLIAGSNQWPEELPEFKSAMLDYFLATEKLSAVLLQSFAQALNLPSDFFTALFDKPNSRLKLNHYPPQDNPQHEHDIGVLPHADSGGFTILWQDESGGLEIQSKSGEWVGAPPIENTFVINLGKVMQVWTNGQFSATPHRVINRGGKDRYSIPLFVNPNSDVVIEPLVGERSADFVSYRYGDYQQDEWHRAFPVAEIKMAFG